MTTVYRVSRPLNSRESHFNKAVPPLREAYLLTLPHGEDKDGVGGADRGSLAHVVLVLEDGRQLTESYLQALHPLGHLPASTNNEPEPGSYPGP